MEVIDKVDAQTTVQMAQLRADLEPPKGERDREGRISLILGYVKAHEGEQITGEEFSRIAGYAHGMGANMVIRKLVAERRLIRERVKGGGRGHHFAYYLGNTTSRGEKNGPTVTNFFEEVVPNQEKQKQAAAIDRLDAEAWTYIKNAQWPDAEALGNAVVGIGGFIQHLREQLDA